MALVVDAIDSGRGSEAESFEVLTPGQLALAPDEFFRMAMLYDCDELCAALKPWLLDHLISTTDGPVLFLAPHVEVHAPINDVLASAAEVGIVLVPHSDVPFPRDGQVPSERAALIEGVFDADVLAVGALGRPILTWWQRNLARDCRRAPEEALFRDQRWMDLVPGYFSARIDRDPTLNVSYWNVHGRSLAERDGGGFVVGDMPLRLVNYSGLRAESPFALLHPSGGPPRIRFSEFPAVATLCHAYLEKVNAASTQPTVDYGFGFLRDGTPLDARMRYLYREALELFESGGGPEPPNPFERRGSDAFLTWLREPAYPELRPSVARYAGRMWADTPDLVDEFPDLVDEGASEFLRWCAGPGSTAMPDSLVPAESEVHATIAARRRRRPLDRFPSGVNLVGYLSAVLGVGEAGRAVGHALAAAGVPLSTLDNPGTTNVRNVEFDQASASFGRYSTNVFAVNADATAWLADQLGPAAFAGRGTIGLWFWEVDRYPAIDRDAINLVDEIWVASDFVRDALQSETDKPVVVIPLPVSPAQAGPELVRERFGFPDERFVFYFTFDFMSVAERKNPFGLVESYRRAFGPDDGAALIIKSINGKRHVVDLERLHLAVAGRPDISLVDEYVTVEEQAAFVRNCDCYVSLHRSEGFGFTMAEAMATGKPVIATGYSGNLAFMNSEVAYLVDHDIVNVGQGREPYPAEARWAEPNLDHASQLMRQVFDRPDQARACGERAAQHLLVTRSLEVVAPRLAVLFGEAQERSRSAPSTWRNHFMRGWRARTSPVLRRNYEYDWLPDGTVVDASVQRCFETALGQARAGKGRPAPNPDAPGGSDATIAWLNEPCFPPRRPIISRYLLQYWEDHAELRERFPDVLSNRQATREFVRWVREHWHEETDIPYRLVPPA